LGKWKNLAHGKKETLFRHAGERRAPTVPGGCCLYDIYMVRYVKGNFVKRVIAYIDGFNFYFGLKSKGWKKLYWLDYQKLMVSLLHDDQQLVLTKYFTAKIEAPPDKARRQKAFLDALKTLNGFEIYYGHYLLNNNIPKEKGSDVNLAIELLADAMQDMFDIAFIVTGDSDQAPLLRKIRMLFPEKSAVILFPPNRVSKELKNLGFPSFVIGRRNISKSQFPDEIVKPNCEIIRRPSQWNK